jgi:MFS family permease
MAPPTRKYSNESENASEQTPLLAAGTVAPTSDPAVSEATAQNGHADRPSSGSDEDEKPMPVGQILLLCYARLVEPIAYFAIFPYISEMAKSNGNLETSDVVIPWGRAADRFGRKPVLVISLIGVSCATALFGTAQTIWQMILYRCIAGVFAGTIVTIRTMLAEHSTPKTQARTFSWFAFTGNLGIFLGPLLGGALADPATQYGGVFRRLPFFVKLPYALPSLVVACIGASSAITSALFLKETLKKDPPKPSSADEESPASQPAKPSTWELLEAPGVGIVLYNYMHVMLLAFSYTAIVPVWWFTPVDMGGYGFRPVQMSFLLGLNGLAQAVWLLLVFPPLQRRIGTNGVMRACSVAYPIFFALCPLGNVLLRLGLDQVFWAIVPATLAVGCGVSMSFTAIQLAVNDVAPAPAVLGTLNALALAGVSGMRAFSPALFSSLYAFGARTQWLWGNAIWVLLVVMALWFTVITGWLPDYEELKRKREERPADGLTDGIGE